MAEIAKEHADLAKADENIHEGQARIANQIALIDELRRDGHDTYDAQKLLWAMQQSLDAWKAHRGTIRVIEKSRQRLARGGIGS